MQVSVSYTKIKDRKTTRVTIHKCSTNQSACFDETSLERYCAHKGYHTFVMHQIEVCHTEFAKRERKQEERKPKMWQHNIFLIAFL